MEPQTNAQRMRARAEDPELLARIRALREQGASLARIAREMALSEYTARALVDPARHAERQARRNTAARVATQALRAERLGLPPPEAPPVGRPGRLPLPGLMAAARAKPFAQPTAFAREQSVTRATAQKYLRLARDEAVLELADAVIAEAEAERAAQQAEDDALIAAVVGE